MEAIKLDVNKELIKLVQKHPNIYDLSLRSYEDNQKKNDSWSAITIEFNRKTGSRATETQVINQWKELKKELIKYRGELKKYIPSDSAQQTVKPQWEYYPDMAFLEDKIAHRETTSNFTSKNPNEIQEVDSSSEDADDEDSDVDKNADNIFHDSSAQERAPMNNKTNPEETSSETKADLTNEYLKVLYNAWCKVPENKREECFLKLMNLIDEKKSSLRK